MDEKQLAAVPRHDDPIYRLRLRELATSQSIAACCLFGGRGGEPIRFGDRASELSDGDDRWRLHLLWDLFRSEAEDSQARSVDLHAPLEVAVLPLEDQQAVGCEGRQRE